MEHINDQDAYYELSLYTLGLQDTEFIHQYIVDAYAAQHATENTKPITLWFALAGLYLHIEEGYSGKEVQRAHMKMAQHKKDWPTFTLPKERGDITVHDVLKALLRIERNKMIEAWTISVWNSWEASHFRIKDLLQPELPLR